MQFKIVQKKSGEVTVYQKMVRISSLHGGELWAADTLAGRYIETEEWEKIDKQFLCWEQAERYIKDIKKDIDLNSVVREETYNV
jgi:hypothetical protein